MKQIILVSTLTLVLLSCGTKKNDLKGTKLITAASESRRVLSLILETAKEQSLYADNVNWEVLESEVYARLIEADTITSIIAPTRYLLGELGDYHGFLVLNGKQYGTRNEKSRAVNYDSNSESYIEKHSEIVSMLIENKKIEAKIIHDSIAYIEIPFFINNQGVDSINIDYAVKLRAAICDLSKNNPKGYIIDLRRNLGGTVYPMLSGLGEMFTNVDLGGTTKDNNTYAQKWKLKNGNFYFGKTSLSNMPKIECNISLDNLPVVVLVGRYTGSSGEFVAAALRGQNNVLLIGEQTAGYTTTNSWFYISDKISLNPSISLYMSKDGTVHTDGVIPDREVLEDLNLENLLSGKVIESAVSIINMGFSNVGEK